jgi:hypothetical protein
MAGWVQMKRRNGETSNVERPTSNIERRKWESRTIKSMGAGLSAEGGM